MTSVQEIHSALLQMQSQIETIRAHEIAKTAQALKSLSKKLEIIEQKELEETRANLHSLATEISSVERTEFSFLRIFGLEHNEVVHSSFLAWLLDPLESHASGSFFVKRFLERTELEIEELDFFPDLSFLFLDVDHLSQPVSVGSFGIASSLSIKSLRTWF